MKRQETWIKLQEKMSGKRARTDTRKNKKGSAPNEIIVQRLASEADNKQTFRPVQPRVFVEFKYDEMTLGNLKRACAEHFNLPTSTCDVLVSNKGPSCSNITQIPHRKDKVYLVRFVVMQDDPLEEHSFDSSSSEESSSIKKSFAAVPSRKCKSAATSLPKNPQAVLETAYPASISIDALLKAGKLVKPQPKIKASLTFEKFDVKTQQWVETVEEEVLVDPQKFSSGAFRDAFHATTTKKTQATQWVVKTYNSKAVNTIQETLHSSLEDHCRKQVQMHAVARHLTNSFKLKAPAEFGKCFSYNRCFYTKYQDQSATIEEYVPGKFIKLINNDGRCIEPPETASQEHKELFAKAQCLVHFTYSFTEEKIMLLDIQGSNYDLYDPEIATSDLMDEKTDEVYFCCGNCSSVGMETFMDYHTCNEFCKMMDLTI